MIAAICILVVCVVLLVFTVVYLAGQNAELHQHKNEWQELSNKSENAVRLMQQDVRQFYGIAVAAITLSADELGAVIRRAYGYTSHHSASENMMLAEEWKKAYPAAHKRYERKNRQTVTKAT